MPDNFECAAGSALSPNYHRADAVEFTATSLSYWKSLPVSVPLRIPAWGNKDYRTSLKSFGALASARFIRAIKKSNALYDAMESRCYDGTIHVLNETYPPVKKEIAAIVNF